MSESIFELTHIAGFGSLKSDQKYQFTVNGFYLSAQIPAIFRSGQVRLGLDKITDLSLDIRSKKEWSTAGKAWAGVALATMPLLAPLSLLMKKDKMIPILRIEYQEKTSKFSRTAFLMGPDAAKLYQKLLNIL